MCIKTRGIFFVIKQRDLAGLKLPLLGKIYQRLFAVIKQILETQLRRYLNSQEMFVMTHTVAGCFGNIPAILKPMPYKFSLSSVPQSNAINLT
jgi:hypothetical protein